MKRRLVVSFLGITAVVLLLLAVPMAYLLQSVATEETRAVLQQQADFVAGRLSADDATPLDTVFDALGDGTAARVTFGDGQERLLGVPPAPPLITANAISEGGIRIELSTSDAEARERVRRAMVVLLGLGVAGLLATWLLAQAEARRLGQPLQRLVSAAGRLGSGDFTAVAPRSGIPEFDSLAETLDASAARIDSLVQAERQFNADASHQLRSALTALRLRIEAITTSDDHEVVADAAAALEQVDRLAATVDDLLRMARTGRAGVTATYDVRGLVADHLADARVTLERARRSLLSRPGDPVFVDGASGAVGQALDVLLNNAGRHGRGSVTVEVTPRDTWVEIDVGDEGAMDPSELDTLFLQQDPGGGHGLGLRLARRLVESEGGTLDLVSSDPTTFRIRLPITHPDDLDGPSPVETG